MNKYVDVVYASRRHRIATADLDLGDLSSKVDVKRAVERALGLPVDALAGHVVLRFGGATWIRLPLAARLRAARVRLAAFRARLGRLVARAGAPLVRGLGGIVGGVMRLLGRAVEFVLDGLGTGIVFALTALDRVAIAATRGLARVFGLMIMPLRRVGAIAVRVLRAADRAVASVLRPVRALVLRGGAFVLRPVRALSSAVRTLAAAAGELTLRAVAFVLRPVRALSSAVRALAAAGRMLALRAVALVLRPVRALSSAVRTLAAAAGELTLRAVAFVLRPVRALVAVGGRTVHVVRRRLRTVCGRAAARLRALGCLVALARDWIFGVVDTLVTGRRPEDRERDHRAAMFEALLTSPHRRLEALHPAHATLAGRDPLFYVRLAAWYARRGEGRDHLEMFTAVLITSALAEHREVGLALLRDLPPYEVGRVVDFIRGRVVRRGRRTERVGLFRNPSRALRTEVARYLREREASSAAFDGAVLAAREPLKRLYGTLHIRPSARAQAILFDRQPPADSRLAAVKALREASTEDERAAILRQHRIPYRVASSLLPRSEVAALLEHMTPAEVINHMSLLRRRGALDDPTLQARVEEKLRDAVDDARVSTFKPVSVEADDAWTERLRAVTEARIRKGGRLRQPTALLVDASASMGAALALGKRIAVMLAVAADAPLHVYAFNAGATRVEGGDLGGWARAFDAVVPSGATSLGTGVLALLREAIAVQRIVIISDQRENQRPRLFPALRLYRRRMATDLRVVFVNLGDATDDVERACRRLRMEVASWRFGGDDYSIPDLLPLLVAPTRTELVLDIMSTALPRRRDG